MLKEKSTAHKKSAGQGAQVKPNSSNQFQSYVDIHAHALFSSLGRLTRTPAAFIMTVLVLAVSMALSTSFYLMIKNFQLLTGTIEASNQISVYLKPAVSQDTTSKLIETILKDPQVLAVQAISPEDGLAEFKANSGLAEAIDALHENPLPAVLQVLPKDTLKEQQDLKILLSKLQLMPEVDVVKSDMQWIKRLRGIMAVAKQLVLLLSGLFAMAVLLIVGNTVRLELKSRQPEVLITQLVGATNAYIRRPFLYTGFWLGFLASVAAWFIVTLSLLIMREPIQTVSQQYNSQYNVAFLDYVETGTLIGVASLLGIIGAWLVLGSQLRALKPE